MGNILTVLDQAKRYMLKQGKHDPMVFVITKEQQSYRLQVLETQQWNKGALGRKKALLLLGRSFAQEECITTEMITALFFVQEMWFVEREKMEDLPDSPAQEPDRRECLGVLELQTGEQTVEQFFWKVDIIRHGGIIDLGPAQKMEQPESGLLTGFLAGVISAQW